MEVSLSVSQACEIAAVDRLRFNEAVAAGHYPCAPEVAERRPRMFSENDLIALCSYGMHFRNGWPPRLAGHYACLLRGALDMSSEQDDEVVIIVGTPGDRKAFPCSHPEASRLTSSMDAPVHYRMTINVRDIREHVRKHVAELAEG